jgi:hypothetical protein
MATRDPLIGTPWADIGSRSAQDKAGYNQRNVTAAVVDAYQNTFGRLPTQDELNQAFPAFDDSTGGGLSRGNSFVSQIHQNEQNTPDKLYANEQQKYLQQAPQHYDSVNQIFQSNLGRQATQDELNHFGSLLASGTTDPYQLQQFLQQQPEYQTAQNQKFTSGLSDTLAGYDKQYFQNQILPSIQEAYAKQGRSFDSSGFQNAATQSAQQQNTQRQQYLAGLSAQQYGGVQDRAYQDYANMVANQQGLTNAGINAQYQGIQNSISRSNEISDYNTQQNLYNQYLAKYGKRNNGVGGLIGGLVGMAGGAYFGKSPQAAGTGFQMGSAFGQAGQNMAGGSY